MMIALRDGEKALSELAAGGALSESEAKSVLDLAVQLHYVTVDDETYQAAIPVLTEVDAPMLREVRRIGREVMGAWFDERYDPLRAELSDLGFVRHGVPLEDGFYWVWRYLFGVANRELAAAGLFIDPYGPASRFEGFLPVVWLGSVTIE